MISQGPPPEPTPSPGKRRSPGQRVETASALGPQATHPSAPGSADGSLTSSRSRTWAVRRCPWQPLGLAVPGLEPRVRRGGGRPGREWARCCHDVPAWTRREELRHLRVAPGPGDGRHLAAVLGQHGRGDLERGQGRADRRVRRGTGPAPCAHIVAARRVSDHSATSCRRAEVCRTRSKPITTLQGAEPTVGACLGVAQLRGDGRGAGL